MQPQRRSSLEDDVCIHIFSVSAALVGVCLTVIGLMRVVIVVGRRATIADDLLAFDAVLFLASCLMSYWVLRTRRSRRMQKLEQAADATFMLAMALMVVTCLVITYSIAVA